MVITIVVVVIIIIITLADFFSHEHPTSNRWHRIEAVHV